MRDNLKIVFHRPGQNIGLPKSELPYQSGLMLSNASTIRDHLYTRNIVGNLGNAIHRSAMMQMIGCDRSNSSQVDLIRMHEKCGSAKAVADRVNDNFDGLFLTFANVIRPGASEGILSDIIEHVDIPIYSVGMGLQNELPLGDPSVLHPKMRKLLSVLNEKAAIFGVRGQDTLNYLESIGIQKASALGCPSMFAYPNNVLSIKSPKSLAKIIVAGRLAPAKSPKSRTHQLVRGLQNTNCSFVFQEELIHFHDIMDLPGVYDEATQSLDFNTINTFIEDRCGFISPFTKYFSFGETSAWRQACSYHDLYIGDRIHGGVAAMQVGVPALVLYNDFRVKELCEYHGIPHCLIDEFAEKGAQWAVRKYLNEDSLDRFHARYRKVLGKFERAMHNVGLPLHNRLQGAGPCQLPEHPAL